MLPDLRVDWERVDRVRGRGQLMGFLIDRIPRDNGVFL